LIVKKEGITKMVDGLICKVIDTGTVNVTYRDETVRVLKVVRYVLEVWYNLISTGFSMKKDVGSKCSKASSRLAKEAG